MKLTTSKQLSTLDDNELVLLIAEQNKEALAQLYERYRHTLGAFLNRRLFQQKLVDEVYNDVMLVVWQKAGEFGGKSKVSTWIFGIAYRTCLSHARKEMKHTKNASVLDFDTLPANINDEDSVSEDRLSQLKRALKELTETHRVVIELAYFDGYSLNEIAEILACPINTVKTRLFHARQNLKNIISD